MVSFDALPLAAVINGRFLCVHGGLSPEMVDKGDIDTISRFQEPPMCGIFCDILWADPAVEENGRPKNSLEPFIHNDVRGCSYFFGYEACNRFLKRNNYLTLIRAHEAKLDGYQCHNWNNEAFPQVITIFSAPNYCGVYQNVAGFINFENNEMSIQQFFPCNTGAPYTLPNNLNVWTWSIPFVSEKVIEIFLEIIKETKEIVDDHLTPQEEARFQKFLQMPEIKRIITPDPIYAGDNILTSQLELALQKKQSEKMESEKLIKGVSLHDSILDMDVVEMVGGQGMNHETSPKHGEAAPVNPNVFNYVKGFDLHNEKRPEAH